MNLTVIFNAIFAVGVIAMIVTPLVWAIFTQHRDHPRQAATEGATIPAPQSRDRRPSHSRNTSPSWNVPELSR